MNCTRYNSYNVGCRGSVAHKKKKHFLLCRLICESILLEKDVLNSNDTITPNLNKRKVTNDAYGRDYDFTRKNLLDRRLKVVVATSS